MWVHADRLEASQADPPAITMNEDVMRGEKKKMEEPSGVCAMEKGGTGDVKTVVTGMRELRSMVEHVCAQWG